VFKKEGDMFNPNRSPPHFLIKIVQFQPIINKFEQTIDNQSNSMYDARFVKE
jgi:hypothetical protein